MASDWIKMRVDLYRDPKVCALADILMDEDGALARYINQNMQRDMCVTRNVMRNVTVGALLSVWGVMRSRGKRSDDDLVCRGVTCTVIDDIAEVQGFGAAMLVVGWVEETTEGIVFPRFFEEHNTDPAEASKQKNAERQRRFRERQQSLKSNVTDNVTVTHREEKRREEYSVTKVTAAPPPEIQPLEKSKTELWKSAVSLLGGQGVPESQARTLIGKLAKDYNATGEDIVLKAVEGAVLEQPADARAYLKATCQRLAGERKRDGAKDWTTEAI